MSLRRLYNLREMSVNVPDTDVPALKKVIRKAVLDGELPGEAVTAWFPRDKGKEKGGEAVPSSEPKAKGKAGKAKAKAEPEAPKSIPLSPDAKAQLDKGQSAWDKLGNAGDARPKAEPWKPVQTGFDATHHDVGGDYGKEFPQFPEPKSANVKLNKKGQPEREPEGPDMFAGHKKPGVLSRVFGKKAKGPQFTDNPYELEPQQKAPAGKSPDLSKFFGDEEPGEPESSGQQAIAGLKDMPPKEAEPSGGDSAMADLKWDLDRTDRERRQKKNLGLAKTMRAK